MTLSEFTTRALDTEGHRAFVAVAAFDDLVVATPLRVDLDNRPPVMVVRTDDGVFAVDDTCSHQDTSLSAGWVEGCAVECPLHEACFDLRTGAAMGPPATRPIATHAVQVVDGLVSVWVGGADAASDAA